jgi:UDP-3-O-[3-hydroxymyristoyl] glucosamine N-acyltransferase
MKAAELFTLPPSLARFAAAFPPDAAPWEWVARIAEALAAVPWAELPPRRDWPPGLFVQGSVYLHPSVRLPPYGVVQGPAWIGAETEIRPGAFVRGNVIVGERGVLGNACEYKNCLLLDDVQTPHYNYVGDSVLGNGAHLGAGAICANLRLDHQEVPVHLPESTAMSGLRKLGALLGDGAEAGCNVVLQPGTILGRRAAVLPGAAFGGYLEPETLAVPSGQIRRLPRRT